MANFIPAHNFVIAEEGGYQDLTSDSGNYVDGQLIGTNYGISAPVLKTFLGRTPTKSEMENLSFDDSVLIYIKNYWKKIYGDDIENESVALVIYDGTVNQGRGALRGIVGPCMRSLGVKITNEDVFSKRGIDKLNKIKDQEKLFNCIWKGRKDRYVAGSGEFKTGHLNRLSKIKFSNKKRRFPTWAIITISVGVVSLLSLSIYTLTKKQNTRF